MGKNRGFHGGGAVMAAASTPQEDSGVTHTKAYLDEHVCVYLCMCVCVYVCMYVSVNMCII